MSLHQTRGMRRSKPVCWLNTTAQFFNVIPWPSAFYNYERKEKDVVAVTFNLITQLRAKKTQPISADQCNKAAQYFIDYVNYQKTKIITDNIKISDAKWHIDIEQDAEACVCYFLNMVANLEDDRAVPDALTVTAGNITIIDRMQKFIRNNFAFATSDWLNCENKQTGHVCNTVAKYMLTLDLPADNTSCSLQQLINMYIKPEPVDLLQCEHCKESHSDIKQTKFAQLSETYLMIHLKRFTSVSMQSRKKNNAIDCTKHVVLNCNNVFTAYKVLSLVIIPPT